MTSDPSGKDSQVSRREFETIEEVVEALKSDGDLSRAVFQDLDLNVIADELGKAVLKGNVLLGCHASPEVLACFESPIVLPVLPRFHFGRIGRGCTRLTNYLAIMKLGRRIRITRPSMERPTSILCRRAGLTRMMFTSRCVVACTITP